MKNKYNVILLLISLVSLLIFFSDSFIVALLIIILIVIGMDISTDMIYEKTDGLLAHKPGMLMGITLFAFITSLDEIFVSGSSIVQRYYDISIGTMLGSVTVGAVIFAVIVLAMGKRQHSGVSASMFLVPGFLLSLTLMDFFSLPIILKASASILTVVVSFILIFFIGFSSDRGTEIKKKSVKKLNVAIIIVSISILMALSFAMARVTDIFSVSLKLDGVASGFIVPGLIGTLPEFFAIKSSLKHSDRKSANGILIGSTLIKGGIIFPILAVVFAYNPLNFMDITIGTILPLIVGIIILIAY